MGATATRMTVEQFMQLTNEQAYGKELINGELVDMGSANRNHEIVKANFIMALAPFLRETGRGRLHSESLYRLTDDEGVIPDLSVQMPRQHSGDGPFQGAPILAIEIVSSDPADHLMHKVRAYLTHGARSVWLVYPADRVVVVNYPDGTSRTYASGQTISDPELLPGFELTLDSAFDGLDG
jgi:Uma2 family endonuclease